MTASDRTARSVAALRAAGLIGDDAGRGFVRTGHFRFESGDHGDLALELDLLFSDPRRIEQAGEQLAAKLAPLRPALVCGPLVGGALLGQVVARCLGVRFASTSLAPVRGVDGAVAYRLPFALRPLARAARVVVVDDAINAGSAVLATIREVESFDGVVAGVGALIVQLPIDAERWARRGLRLEYLAGIERNLWPPEECPLCAAGVALEPLTPELVTERNRFG